uniref:trypsin n=1 Tax=Amphilophus citrinellus TaxID=61819 RepID=A0A3Q0T5J8_AMPCI
MVTHLNLMVLVLVLTLQEPVHTGEIIGGHEVVAHSRPYMVLLERHMSNGQKKYCDGFLLNEEFVMTAAHCHAKFYRVFLGLHDYRKQNGVWRVNVYKKFQHKGFNETDFRNDIMLLKLSAEVKFNDKVKPVALADDDGSVPKSCVVPGWGTTEKGELSDVLLEVNVTLTDSEICAKENKYCSEGQTGPSTGDSGGPLVCEDGKAYGVVSASRPKPGGSTIYSYISLIKLVSFDLF